MATKVSRDLLGIDICCSKMGQLAFFSRVDPKLVVQLAELSTKVSVSRLQSMLCRQNQDWVLKGTVETESGRCKSCT